MAPGQRIEVLADFSQWQDQEVPRLVSLQTPQSNPFPLLNFNRITSGKPQPRQNIALPPLQRLTSQDATQIYSFSLGMSRMSWAINGRTYKENRVARDEKMKLNETAIWEFINDGSGMMGGMMELPHPMHIHGVQFQILDRQTPANEWSELRSGYVDEGWQDTVLVTPGERVKVIMRFTEPGMFVYHCHNLEHGDMGMMRNFEVL